MEDPNSRPTAAKLIDSVIKEYNVQAQQDALTGTFRAGLSLSMKIYNALKLMGYLKEE